MHTHVTIAGRGFAGGGAGLGVKREGFDDGVELQWARDLGEGDDTSPVACGVNCRLHSRLFLLEPGCTQTSSPLAISRYRLRCGREDRDIATRRSPAHV